MKAVLAIGVYGLLTLALGLVMALVQPQVPARDEPENET